MDRQMSSALARLHPRGRIDSADECDRLEAAIKELLKEGSIEEIPVREPEHHLQEEHWYRDRFSDEVYRYIPPNFPARGSWEKIR
jgi:hypothetical protein